MKNIELACYALLASAFVLAGVLVVQFRSGDAALLPKANADMVLARENITVMSANTQEDEESVFIIENTSQMLLIYTLDAPRNQIELNHVQRLDAIFVRNADGGMPTTNNAPRGRRTDR